MIRTFYISKNASNHHGEGPRRNRHIVYRIDITVPDVVVLGYKMISVRLTLSVVRHFLITGKKIYRLRIHHESGALETAIPEVRKPL